MAEATVDAPEQQIEPGTEEHVASKRQRVSWFAGGPWSRNNETALEEWRNACGLPPDERHWGGLALLPRAAAYGVTPRVLVLLEGEWGHAAFKRHGAVAAHMLCQQQQYMQQPFRDPVTGKLCSPAPTQYGFRQTNHYRFRDCADPAAALQAAWNAFQAHKEARQRLPQDVRAAWSPVTPALWRAGVLVVSLTGLRVLSKERVLTAVLQSLQQAQLQRAGPSDRRLVVAAVGALAERTALSVFGDAGGFVMHVQLPPERTPAAAAAAAGGGVRACSVGACMRLLGDIATHHSLVFPEASAIPWCPCSSCSVALRDATRQSGLLTLTAGAGAGAVAMPLPGSSAWPAALGDGGGEAAHADQQEEAAATTNSDDGNKENNSSNDDDDDGEEIIVEEDASDAEFSSNKEEGMDTANSSHAGEASAGGA